MKDCIVEASTDYGVKDYLKGLTEEQVARLRQIGWNYPDNREHLWQLDFIGMLSEIGVTKEEFPEIGAIKINKLRGLNYDKDFVSAVSQHALVEPVAQSPIQVSVYNEALL